MNWAQMTCQDDPSPYVGTLCQILTDRMAEIIKHLSTSYVRLFCNKFIVYFPRRFTQQFYRCRRISDQGCQQLLMDLQHMRQVWGASGVIVLFFAGLISFAADGVSSKKQQSRYQQTLFCDWWTPQGRGIGYGGGTAHWVGFVVETGNDRSCWGSLGSCVQVCSVQCVLGGSGIVLL